jgi:hypothetical protein
MVQASPGKIVQKTLSQKTHHRKRAGGVAEGGKHLPIKYEFKSMPQKEKKKTLASHAP